MMTSDDVFDRAAAEMATDLERYAIIEIVNEQMKKDGRISTPTDFSLAVVFALHYRGYNRGTGEVQYILNGCRKKNWKDVPDARKHIDEAMRRAAEQGKEKGLVYLSQVPDPMLITPIQAANLQSMAQQAPALSEQDPCQDREGEKQSEEKVQSGTMTMR